MTTSTLCIWFDVKEKSPVSCGAWRVVRVMPSSYVLEAAVQDLQLLAGETRLGFKLLQALGAMADCRQLELIFDAVWNRGREKVRRRHTLAQMSNSEGSVPITVEISTTADEIKLKLSKQHNPIDRIR